MYCLLSLCCVCLSEREELQNLTNTDVDNVQLLDKLNFCAFETDWIQSNYPIFICYKCYHNLRVAYEFKKMCHKNGKLLRGYVSQLNNDSSMNAERYNAFKQTIQDTHLAQYCKTEMDYCSKIGMNELPVKQETSNGNQLSVPPPQYTSFATFDDRPLNCPLCSRTFTQKLHLDKHLITHSTAHAHTCIQCNKTFSRKLHLERHMLTHSGKRTHHCPQCPKSFILKSHLNGHMLTHTGIRSHHCTLCPKNFARKSDLHRHMLIHTVEKSYSCTFCAKGFARKSHLARHMIFHSGKRPHQCTVCTKSFILKSHLNDHMLTHTGVKSHHCTVCLKSFGRKSDLNRHMLTHNSEKTQTFALCNNSIQNI